MKISAIKEQQKNPDRLNVYVDGKYSFSLHFTQVVDLKISVGREIDEADLELFLKESDFGKHYLKALNYCLLRPHSKKEVLDYLGRKKIEQNESHRIVDKLVEKGYVDDKKFAIWWIENRNNKKGSSLRKLKAELRQKSVDDSIIQATFEEANRSDKTEIMKVISRKYKKYDDKKLLEYLLRIGFLYDDAKEAIDDYKASLPTSG